MRDRRAGGATLPLLVLLVAAGGAGAYNYHRNLQAEATVPRPYKGYSDSELEALVQAYDDEVTRLDARYLEARQQRAEQRGGQLLDERVEDFERAPMGTRRLHDGDSSMCTCIQARARRQARSTVCTDRPASRRTPRTMPEG